MAAERSELVSVELGQQQQNAEAEKGEGEPRIQGEDAVQRAQSAPAGRKDDGLPELIKSKGEEMEKEALELLQQLLRIDTQNFMDEGTEIQAVLLLKEKFEEAGIPYEIIEPKPGRGNIVARLAGDGSSGKGAILLSAHLDTVRAPKENWEEEGWKHNPYGGEIDEEDGCIYGRGAIDMKHMAAMSVTLLRFLKRNGIKLSRDLVFAGLADEERTDSKYGVKYLVENHPQLIEADVVLNEVGGFSLFVAGKETFLLEIAEKGSATMKITARGTGGHGSLYHTDNPIAKIGEVAQKLATVPFPLRVVTANRLMIETLSKLLPFPKSAVFLRVLSPRFSDFIMNVLLTEDQFSLLSPLLRNMANPTVVGGGDQVNQVPSSAWVLLNARILPECTVDDVLHDIQEALGPSNFLPRMGPQNEELPPVLTIEVLSVREPLFQDPSEPLCQEVIEVIRKVVANRANGATVLPTLCPGATDSYHYARNPRRKPVCLGFTPLRLPEDLKFAACYHGVNERIPVDGFKWGVRVLTDIVCELCAAKVE